MGFGSFKRFVRGAVKQTKKATKKLTHVVANPIAETYGALSGSKAAEERIRGAADVLVGGSQALGTLGIMGTEQTKEGVGKVITGGRGGQERSAEEAAVFAIPELQLTPEQRRIRSAVEARERQKKGGRGRSGSMLTSQRLSQQAQTGPADTILTTQKGTSILGR